MKDEFEAGRGADTDDNLPQDAERPSKFSEHPVEPARDPCVRGLAKRLDGWAL